MRESESQAMATATASLERGFSRRAALGLIGGTAGALLLPGCGSSSEAPNALPFTDHSGARLTAILRESFIETANDLTRRHSQDWATETNASIDLRMLANWREEYHGVARRRNGADLAELFGPAPQIYADRLLDLSELAEGVGEAQGGWMTAARELAIVDGVWRAIPWLYTAHALNYREDYLAAAKVPVPQTYDDLLEVATALHDADLPLVGFSMNTAAPNDSASLAYSMLWSFGGQEVDESGKRVALDSRATRAALEFFAELAAVSYEPAFRFDEVQNNNAFLESRISMTQNASSIYWNALRDVPAVAEVMNHSKYPSGPAGYHQLIELNSIAIFDHTRNADAATDWIRHMISPDQIGTLAKESLSFFTPTLLDYVGDASMPWNVDPKLSGMHGVHDGGHMPGWPGPSTIESGLVYSNATLVKMFQSVAQGGSTITEAISTATNDLRRVYET